MSAVESDKTRTGNSWVKIMLVSTGAMMLFVYTGITEAHSAILLPQLREPDSIIRVTPEVESWIASLGILTSPIGAIICGPLIDFFGRKRGLQLFFIVMTIGFGIIGAANCLTHIYIGRLLCAMGAGSEIISIVYLAEISSKKQRSILFSMVGAVFSFGVTLTYILGGYLPWQLVSAGFSLTSLVFFIVSSVSPESPAWLYKTGKVEESIKSFKTLGRSDAEITEELEILKLDSKQETVKVNFRIFLESTVWKPFVILSVFQILQVATGIFDLLYYSYDFLDYLETSYDTLTLTIILSVVRFIANCTVAIHFTSSVPRKTATSFSGFFMGLSAVGAGVYEYIYRNKIAMSRPWQWFPIVLVFINVIASCTGVTCLPWLMSGEVFPLQVRGIASGAVYVIGCLTMFVTIKYFYLCVSILKVYGFLFTMALFSFVVQLFGMYILPETQNKSLYEIQQTFRKKRKQLN